MNELRQTLGTNEPNGGLALRECRFCPPAEIVCCELNCLTNISGGFLWSRRFEVAADIPLTDWIENLPASQQLPSMGFRSIHRQEQFKNANVRFVHISLEIYGFVST